MIPIDIPPLRDRREDIPALVEHFIDKHAQRTGKRFAPVGPAVLDTLREHDWPGNVRELENSIERAVVLASGSNLDASDISILGPHQESRSGLPTEKLHDNVEWAERESVKRALATAQGVKKKAAEFLGISQRALSYCLAKYQID